MNCNHSISSDNCKIKCGHGTPERLDNVIWQGHYNFFIMVYRSTRNAQRKANASTTPVIVAAEVFEDSSAKLVTIAVVGKVVVATDSVPLSLLNAHTMMIGQWLTALYQAKKTNIISMQITWRENLCRNVNTRPVFRRFLSI